MTLKREHQNLIAVGVAVAVLSTGANHLVGLVAATVDENTWDEELLGTAEKLSNRILPLEQSVLDLAIGRREEKEERQAEKRLKLEEQIGVDPANWSTVERQLWEQFSKVEKKARKEREELEQARDSNGGSVFSAHGN